LSLELATELLSDNGYLEDDYTDEDDRENIKNVVKDAQIGETAEGKSDLRGCSIYIPPL